jgi:hypothetical protein
MGECHLLRGVEGRLAGGEGAVYLHRLMVVIFPKKENNKRANHQDRLIR